MASPEHLPLRSLAWTAGLVACGLICGCGGAPPDNAPLANPRMFGESGTSPGQFMYPRALDAGAGALWIVDKTARIQRIEPETGNVIEWWQMPQWKLGKPTGITVWEPRADVAGVAEPGVAFVLVPDTHYHRVMIYAVARDAGRRPLGELAALHAGEGTLVAEFGSYGEGDAQFIYPTDVAVIASEDGSRVDRLLVGEYGGHDRISMFERVAGSERTPAGAGAGGEYRFVSSFGGFGGGDGVEFNRPQSLVYDAKRREVLVADACNHRVGRFTLDGALVAWYGQIDGRAAREGEGRFNYPYGLADAGDGTVLVTEFGAARIHRIDIASGSTVGIYGRPGRHAGEFAMPWACVVLDHRLYVLDSGHDRVQSIELPPARSPHSGLAAASGVSATGGAR